MLHPVDYVRTVSEAMTLFAVASRNLRSKCNGDVSLATKELLKQFSDKHPDNEIDARRECASFMLSMDLAEFWVSTGRIRYVLGHDVASMLMLTSAPTGVFAQAPHDSFLVELPREFLPVSASSRTTTVSAVTTVSFQRRMRRDGCIGHIVGLHPDPWTTATYVAVADDSDEEQISSVLAHAVDAAPHPDWQHEPLHAALGSRLIRNLISYIAEFKSCARSSRGTKTNSDLVIRPSLPVGVVIDRAFHRAAAELGNARDLRSIRRAMAHMVRGHWRLQPCGHARSEIKRTWVRPHRRGDQSFGNVIEKINRIN